MNDLILSSIGACVAQADTKQESVVTAYCWEGGEVKFLLMPVPKKANYKVKDFLDAIAKAEKVKNVIYRNENNTDRPVYMCREQLGKIKDVVDRDVKADRFIKGFCEIAALKINLSLFEKNIKMKQGVSCSFIFKNTVSEYGKDSLEYAIVNAYNAALLGLIFGKTLFLETKYGEPIRHEIRIKKGAPDDSVMDVTPIINPVYGYVDSYETETFHRIDDDGRIVCKYRIIYNPRGSNYTVKRV